MDHDRNLASQLEKWTLIQPCVVEGGRNAHNVFLQIDAQRFCVTPACDTLDEANWFRDQLCIALAKIVAASQHPEV